MAAAEARAAWQRAPNRCFVQEDAKRAPKLACCSSSSSRQNELNIGDATNVQDQRVSSFPFNFNFMSSNLSSDTKWWLQTQPNFSFHKDFIFEQLEGLSNEHVEAEVTTTNQSSLTDEAIHGASSTGSKNKVCPESSCTISETQMEYDSEARILEIEDVTCSIQQQVLERKVESGACYLLHEHSDAKPINCLSSIKTEMANLDMEGPWGGSNKCEPWWHVSDKEELASFVAQKSLENIENCDLPRAAHLCRNPFTCIESWENTIFTSSFGGNLDAGTCRPKEMDEKYRRLDHAHHPPIAAGKLASDAWSSNIAAAESTESQPNSGINQSRTQLLEALRLSQTRARNAEMAAQKAYDEKEHIVKLLLKQASHLFAYKQWLQVLQLETFLQLKIDDHRIASVFPILPWMPLRAADKGGSRRKWKKQKTCWLRNYAFLFAVGLSLAGASLFLGCYLGWL